MKSIAKVAMTALVATAIITVPQALATVVKPVKTTISVHDESVISSSATDPVIKNEALAGTATTKQFNIPPGFGYVKVSFVNTGTKQFTFTINQGSLSGTQKMSGTVPADGKEHTFFSDKAWSTGWFYVNVSSAQGMSGKLGVRVGTDLNELKNL